MGQTAMTTTPVVPGKHRGQADGLIPGGDVPVSAGRQSV